VDPYRPQVLLVYANPAVTATPVGPYGMEKIGHAFGLAGCVVTMIAPWIEGDPLAALRAALDLAPDLIGFSVRNMDDALVVRGGEGAGAIDTTDYLGVVRPLVDAAVERVGTARVLIGGAAVGAGGVAVVRALGATRGIAGPAEDLCWRLGRSLQRGEGPQLPADPRIIDVADADGLPAVLPRGPFGWRAPPGPTPRMGPYLGLIQARGGRVAVQLTAGCDRRCSFCVEASFLGRAVAPRAVDDVLAEIKLLRGHGFRRFWLVASELNVPGEDVAIGVLRGLEGQGLDLAAFIQPAPLSDALLDAMEGAGMDPTALSFEFGHLDDRILRRGGGPTNRRQIDGLVETWLRRGYAQLGGSVLLGAHPDETDETLDGAMSAARDIDRCLPAGLGLAYACGARVYPATSLARQIAAEPGTHRAHLYTRTLADGQVDPVDWSFVRPVVYSRPRSPRQLLAQVGDALRALRGPTGPMNAEAPAEPVLLAAEALVNRGHWRLQEEQPALAAACFQQAINHVPGHLEAWASLARVQANELGDLTGARASLLSLRALLASSDPRQSEVQAALHQLPLPD
jgi:hypothetical protein